MSGFNITPFDDVSAIEFLVLEVARNLRSADRDEVRAIVGDEIADNPGRIGDAIMGLPGPKFLVSDDGHHTTYAVGGWQEHRKGVVEGWILTTESFIDAYIPMTRAVKRSIIPGLRDGGIHRVECKSISHNKDAHRWLEIMGGVCEGEHKSFGVNREDFMTFAWRF